jgi:hypothetical protein
MSKTTSYYTTEGNVRGSCGHRHRTEEAAERCLAKDQHGCAAQWGYSDRRIVRYVDGERVGDDTYYYLGWKRYSILGGDGGLLQFSSALAAADYARRIYAHEAGYGRRLGAQRPARDVLRVYQASRREDWDREGEGFGVLVMEVTR